jgi:hypothetical protein
MDLGIRAIKIRSGGTGGRGQSLDEVIDGEKDARVGGQLETIAGRKLLVLGAGGAARGIAGALLAERPLRLVIANRTHAKAVELAAQFVRDGPISAEPLGSLSGQEFDIVVNATSLGLGTSVPAGLWPHHLFIAQALAYDLIYADQTTPFLQWARTEGAARTGDGLGMLIEQAAEGFYLWRGVRPDTDPVFRLLQPAGRGRIMRPRCAGDPGDARAADRLVPLQLWYAAHIWWWRDHPPSETAFMSVRLAELKRVNPGARLQYAWVPYQRISVQLKRAMIAAEDARFVEHEGFDWEGIQHAMDKNLKKGRVVAGGSTISQQLAKNLFLSGERSYWRKGEEALITVMLEAILDKRRIFEIYLNVINRAPACSAPRPPRVTISARRRLSSTPTRRHGSPR